MEERIGRDREAAAVHRRAAETDPEEHLPSLARSLSDLGRALIELQRFDEALAAVEEGVAALRRLIGTDRGLHALELAPALTGLSSIRTKSRVSGPDGSGLA